MDARFEVRYLDITWYDKKTILAVQESFLPLKIEFESVSGQFVCHTVIYPEAQGVKHGQLAFRILEKDTAVPYFATADGERVPLTKVTAGETGAEWWIEADSWLETQKRWAGRAHRTAGRLLVYLGTQVCQVDIGLSDATGAELAHYLDDFKSDLWELILDENSYITGEAKNTNQGIVSKDTIGIIGNILTCAVKLLGRPKSELREIQALRPRKIVKPVTRTFMELSTKADKRFLTGRTTIPTYNVPENRYVLFALERVLKILRHLVQVSEVKILRLDAKIEGLSERLKSFGNERLIDVNLVRADLQAMKLSFDIRHLNQVLHVASTEILRDSPIDPEVDKWFIKIGNRTSGADYFAGVKHADGEEWFESSRGSRTVFLQFEDSRVSRLFVKDFEYEIEATVSLKTNPAQTWFTYVIEELYSIKITGGTALEARRQSFHRAREKAIALNNAGWIKKLTRRELDEQEREKRSLRRLLREYEGQLEKSKHAFEELLPRLKMLKPLVADFRKLGITALGTFPNSMTFVQNPNYQGVHSGYRRLLDATSLSNEDILVSMERVDEIGLINMPILYERWCLLQIIKVLVQEFHYVPSVDWKRRLLQIVAGSRSSTLVFFNADLGRTVKLMYETTLKNGRTPDYVMDVTVNAKDHGFLREHRFVMDAKYYSDDLWRRNGGISSVIKELYHKKNYSEDGENAVFILHPAVKAVSKRVSPQRWGDASFLGELEMFDWDASMRQQHYHQYGAVCANPSRGGRYIDEFQRLIGMFLQYGVEDNELARDQSDDVAAHNFCIACGSHKVREIEKNNSNQRSAWYECKECLHFTIYNHCHSCNTRLIKNGDYWTYHSQMPMEPLNIKCPACESLV